MDSPTRLLLLECAGFLNLLFVHRIVPPNAPQQANELLEKIGAALAKEVD